jgi:hypothetical protein
MSLPPLSDHNSRVSPKPSKKLEIDLAKYRNADIIRRDKVRHKHESDYELSQRIEDFETVSVQMHSLQNQVQDLAEKERIRKEKRVRKLLELKLESISEARNVVRKRVARQDEKLNQSLFLHFDRMHKDHVRLNSVPGTEDASDSVSRFI